MTWLQKLEKFPPCLLRMFALTGWGRYRRLKTRKEIAKEGGISQATVAKLTRMTSWKRLTIGTIEGYIKGCGVDPLDNKQMRECKRLYSRQDRKQKFLANSTADQRRMVNGILQRLISGSAQGM